MFDPTLHRETKHFLALMFTKFSAAEEILKSHCKYCFKINGKQRI